MLQTGPPEQIGSVIRAQHLIMTVSKSQLRHWIKRQPLRLVADPKVIAARLPSVTGCKIGVYDPLPPEVDIWPLIYYWFKYQDVQLYFPEVNHQGFHFHLWDGGALKQLSDGTRIPTKVHEVIQADELDICLVPMLGVNHQGVRLGRGGGNYDRYVKNSPAFKWGLIHQHQLVSFVGETHDLVYDQVWQVDVDCPKLIV